MGSCALCCLLGDGCYYSCNLGPPVLYPSLSAITACAVIFYFFFFFLLGILFLFCQLAERFSLLSPLFRALGEEVTQPFLSCLCTVIPAGSALLPAHLAV